jgi:hypothetical protein
MGFGEKLKIKKFRAKGCGGLLILGYLKDFWEFLLCDRRRVAAAFWMSLF